MPLTQTLFLSIFTAAMVLPLTMPQTALVKKITVPASASQPDWANALPMSIASPPNIKHERNHQNPLAGGRVDAFALRHFAGAGGGCYEWHAPKCQPPDQGAARHAFHRAGPARFLQSRRLRLALRRR